MTRAGLPHSDIFGSQPVSGLPKLFVAYYVLHRLQVPRHPPCALSNLTTQNFSILQFLKEHQFNFELGILNFGLNEFKSKI